MAEAAGGELLRLECGRTREELVAELAARATEDPPPVVGFDFSFSLPVWFLDEQGYRDAAGLWAASTRDGERTAREAAAHSRWSGAGFQARRAFGSTSLATRVRSTRSTSPVRRESPPSVSSLPPLPSLFDRSLCTNHPALDSCPHQIPLVICAGYFGTPTLDRARRGS
jgi:hypothetical protein